MKMQKARSLLQLLIELAITLFIAGIVVPSLLRSGVSTSGALAGGSLHTINIAGVTFLFTYKNIGFAILGVLAGATAAFVIEMERPIFWRRHLYRVGRICLTATLIGLRLPVLFLGKRKPAPGEETLALR
jgi:hypothetical protein